MTLANSQRRWLAKTADNAAIPERYRQRCRIILLCDGGLPEAEVARKLRVSTNTVARWTAAIVPPGSTPSLRWRVFEGSGPRARRTATRKLVAADLLLTGGEVSLACRPFLRLVPHGVAAEVFHVLTAGGRRLGSVYRSVRHGGRWRLGSCRGHGHGFATVAAALAALCNASRPLLRRAATLFKSLPAE